MKSRMGFVLGDHQFLQPGTPGPLSRLDSPKRQIRGATPPTYLHGLVRESTTESRSAKALFKGEFCGHGEPTMTIFDVVIDGVEVIEIGAIPDSVAEEEGRNVVLLAARKPNGPWLALFRRAWEDAQAMLVDVKSPKIQPGEARRISQDILRGRVSIGFEYPCDADSPNAVSWMTIDVLEEGKRKPHCLVNAELA